MIYLKMNRHHGKNYLYSETLFLPSKELLYLKGLQTAGLFIHTVSLVWLLLL